MDMNAPNHPTDYRMVKLVDGTLLVGTIAVDDRYLRIENPLQLTTIQRMTEYGIKDDSSLAPWIPFTSDKQFTIPKDKIVVISLAAKELAHYYEVILAKYKEDVKLKIRTPLSPQEIEHIFKVADQMDAEHESRMEEELMGEFYGHKIESKKIH